jgi:hypothetical protein
MRLFVHFSKDNIELKRASGHERTGCGEIGEETDENDMRFVSPPHASEACSRPHVAAHGRRLAINWRLRQEVDAIASATGTMTAVVPQFPIAV